MLIEINFNDEALFQKHKVLIQYVTREIEDIVRKANVRSHLRWSDGEFEALRLDFRVSMGELPSLGIVRVYTPCSISDSEKLEHLIQETLKTIRLMVS